MIGFLKDEWPVVAFLVILAGVELVVLMVFGG